MTTESLPEDDIRMDMGTLLSAIFSRWLRILAVTIILLALAYAILLFVPKMYESQAGILVEPRENAFTVPTTGAPANAGSIAAEATISSQIELIKSRDTLLRVIDQLKLRDVPEFNGAGSGGLMQILGRTPDPSGIDETVLNNLLERLTVIRERDSAIISIFARSRDPQLAAEIANAMAAAHVQRRASQSLSDTAEASVWLEQEIVKLRERVTTAETVAADYRVENDLFAGPNNTSLLEQQLSNIATQITTAQERRNTAQTRAALIRSLLDAGQPLEGVPDVQASVVIQQLSQSKARLTGELAQRSATLLPNHPTIRALNAQIQEIQQQITIEARRVAAGLEAQAQIEADLVTSLQGDLQRAKVSASSATTSTVRLDELEREAKAQRDLLESYLLRYRDALARSDSSSALPDVRVVTLAAPTVTPASPKVSLILAAVAFVSIALQIGGIIFGELMSGRAIVVRERVYEDDESVEEAPEELLPEPTPVIFPEAAPEPVAVVPVMPAPGATAEPPSPPATEPQVSAAAELQVPVEPPAPAADPAVDKTARAPRSPRASKAATEAAARAAAPLLAPTYESRAIELSNLSADLALGRSRVIILAGLGSFEDCSSLGDRLVADALHNGLPIARVDAGSNRPSAEPGLTDLAAELVSFGDVVHRGSGEGVAEVPWGQQTVLNRESTKPLTLVEALTDIYEAVVILTGPLDRKSAITAFTGADCRLVAVGDDAADPEAIEAALSEAVALGFHPVQFVAGPVQQAEVA